MWMHVPATSCPSVQESERWTLALDWRCQMLASSVSEAWRMRVPVALGGIAGLAGGNDVINHMWPPLTDGYHMILLKWSFCAAVGTAVMNSRLEAGSLSLPLRLEDSGARR